VCVNPTHVYVNPTQVAAAAAVCAPLAGLLSTEKFSAMVKAVDKERDASSFGAIFA
jgi:hypothetical protein